MPTRGALVYVDYVSDAGGFRIVEANGTPTLVGLYSKRESAEAFARSRGWQLVAAPVKPTAAPVAPAKDTQTTLM